MVAETKNMDIDYWFERDVGVFSKNFEVKSPVREFHILRLMKFEMLVAFLILHFHLVITYPQGNNDQLCPALVLVR